jgi:hypothetical protein
VRHFDTKEKKSSIIDAKRNSLRAMVKKY